MRKRTAILSAVFSIMAAPAAARVTGADAGATFQPFFDLKLSESFYVPKGKDTLFSGANFDTSVGMRAVMDKWALIRSLPGEHALFGMYNLVYDGPGFKPQDTGEFEYRSLGHNFSLEYQWRVLAPLRLRPGVSYSKTFVRTGANEPWGEGLYDNNTLGAQLAADYLIGDKGRLTAVVGYRDVRYPNFTDLLREFQNAGTQSETSGGLQDNTMIELGANGVWEKKFLIFEGLYAGARYFNQDYEKEKVVESNGVYGGTAQNTDTVSLNAGLTGRLWMFEIQPSLGYAKFSSNQNFLLFRFFGDPAPDFRPDWYSYDEFRADLPLFINFTKRGSAIRGGVSVVHRRYNSREARDVNNQFKGRTQNNTLVTLNGGFRFRITDISYMNVLGGVVHASSNNTYEAFLPYNYTGFTLGVGFELAY